MSEQFDEIAAADAKAKVRYEEAMDYREQRDAARGALWAVAAAYENHPLTGIEPPLRDALDAAFDLWKAALDD